MKRSAWAMLALALAMGAPPAVAGDAPDTTRCGPRIFVREGSTGRPLSSVRVHVMSTAGARLAPVGSERNEATVDDGWLEFAALPIGVYDVSVSGMLARRDAREPSASLHPVSLAASGGGDPASRPQEVQLFDLRVRWSVTSGTCTDSLVVQVPPTRWRKVRYGERVLSLR